MPRKQKDRALLADMCDRTVIAFALIGRDDADLSRALGYANGTTIAKMRRRKTFLDTEPLSRLGTLLVRNCCHINLHWLLTGQGAAFIEAEGTADAKAKATALNALVERG
jgi:phage gp36-like protein